MRPIRSNLRALGVAVALCLPLSVLAAESPDGLWRDVDEAAIAQRTARTITPTRYQALSLDEAALRDRLAAAPREGDVATRESPLVLTLPMPDGRYARFAVVESPIMAPALAAKFPMIRTYLGQGLDDASASVRFDVTQKGLHAQVLSADGTWYVDPLQADDTAHYMSYRRRDLARAGARDFSCTVDHPDGAPSARLPDPAFTQPLLAGEQLRTFRLALAATGEYTAFHGGTKPDGMAGIVTTMNRVNGIYERDVAVRMVLVANNDLLVWTDPATDPYTNNSGTTMLGQNTTSLNALIQPANYDIGHVFSTGGGGVAGLGVVCSSGKARGVTGQGAPTGDGFDVDYVAHEMGHQFGGDHTFNSTSSSCGGGNRNGSTAYETGSGATVMAYAGICGNEDLQPNSDDYFHRGSLDEILAFVGSVSCQTTGATGNGPPVVTAPAAATIPANTPFALTATATDPNGDALTYLWEEMDLGAATSSGAVIVDDGSRPLFRPSVPTTSGTRYFPSLRYILDNANAVPATANLPGTSTPFYTGETLPITNRTMQFKVTARDNRAGGGGTAFGTTAITVSTAAGPFRVTAPNTATTATTGTDLAVTWNVANTTAAPVNTANVKISLSLDGGETYPVVLAASTANDGTETINLPTSIPATTRARVKVEAVGNYYFDVSDANFTVVSGTNSAPTIGGLGTLTVRQGSPAATANVATISDVQDAAGTLAVAVSNAPAELTVSAVNNAGTVALTGQAACTLVAPTSGTRTYPVLLTVTDSAGGVSSANVNVLAQSNLQPTLGTYAAAVVAPGNTVTATPTAAPADDNLAGISVSPTTLPGGGTISVAPSGVVTIATTPTTTVGTYTVTVTPIDGCGAVENRALTVNVASPNALLALDQATVTSGNHVIEPGECNTIDVALDNNGGGAASAISATLSSSTPGVTITQATSAYPTIAPGATASNTAAFEVGTATTIPCGSNVDFTQTITYAGGTSPTTVNFSLPVGSVSTGNYAYTSSTGATIPAGGTLVAGSADDDVAVAMTTPAGFAFSLYGVAIPGGTAIVGSTNGNLQFAAAGTNAYLNAALPIASTAGSGVTGVFPPSNPTIFGYWDDLVLTTGGIFTDVTGTMPNRTWKVEWRGVTFTGSIAVNFAMFFHEGQDGYEIVYANAGGAAGASATLGIQKQPTGTTFTQYSFNTASITAGTRLVAALPPAVCTVGPGPCGGTPPDPLFADGFE